MLALPITHAHRQEWNLILETYTCAGGIWLQGIGTSHIPLLKMNVWPFQ